MTTTKRSYAYMMNPVHNFLKYFFFSKNFFFLQTVGKYHYGPGHPMKPYRVELTNCLVLEYKMHKKMNVKFLISFFIILIIKLNLFRCIVHQKLVFMI